MACKMEQLLAIPGFSNLWLMAPDCPAILIRTLVFRGDAWDVKVSPCGFIKGVPKRIAVWLTLQDDERSTPRIKASLEILDNTWERTIFQDECVAGGHASLAPKRSELEITSCIHNDNIPLRCTLTFIDIKKQKSQNKAAASSKWCLLRRNLSAPPKRSSSNLSEESSMTTDRTSQMHHLITIPGYPKLAQMPTASLLNLRRFRFLGHSWSITLIINGSNETSADSISIIAAARHSGSESADSGVDIAIEILDKSHKHALFHKNQIIGFCSILRVNRTELEAAACLNDDSFTIACTLTSLDKKQQHQDKDNIRTIPHTTDESDLVYTPLLSHHKLLKF